MFHVITPRRHWGFNSYLQFWLIASCQCLLSGEIISNGRSVHCGVVESLWKVEVLVQVAEGPKNAQVAEDRLIKRDGASAI